MRTKIGKRIVRRGALALAVVMIVAPAAQARPIGSFNQQQAAPVVAVHDTHEQGVVGTVGRGTIVSPAGVLDARYAQYGYHKPTQQQLPTVPSQTVSVTKSAPASSFDWSAAGIGAGVALGAMLLLALGLRVRQVGVGRLART